MHDDEISPSREWEPEPLELPLLVPSRSPSPPIDERDHDDDERPGRRVLVIDLA